MKKYFLALFFLLASHRSLPAQESKQVPYFMTQDGQRLVMQSQPSRKNNPIVILLHGLSSSKEEWIPFEEKLKKAGWGFLAYDARGQGASSKTKDANGSPNGFQSFGRPGPGSEWEKMTDDVGAAIRTAKKSSGEKAAIFLAGASVGANVALIYASQHQTIKGVILLSPGLNYQQFTTELPMQKMKTIPVLLVASSADRYAHDSSLILSTKSPMATFWDDVKAGHGTQMFNTALIDRLFQWLSTHR